MTSKTVTWREVVTDMGERFTSVNSIPVERATIRRHEWEAVLQKLHDVMPSVETTEVNRLRAGLQRIGELSLSYKPVVDRLLAGESIEQIARQHDSADTGTRRLHQCWCGQYHTEHLPEEQIEDQTQDAEVIAAIRGPDSASAEQT